MGARTLAALTSVAYVGSVYIMPGARPREMSVPVLWRRFAGVLACTFATVFNFGTSADVWLRPSWHAFFATLSAAACVHILYLVPILTGRMRGVLAEFVGGPKQQRTFKLMMLARNVAIGPITEELVYRGVLLDIYREGGLSSTQFLRENVLYFGLAHLHHAGMRYLDGVASFKICALQALFQFAMTSLFGLYSAYWLLKTNSIFPSIAAHAICNLYGVPPLHGSKAYILALLLSVLLFLASVAYL